MFNNLLRDFEEDPFFADPFRAHSERMHQMVRGFSDPFNHGFMPSITDGQDRGRRGEGQARTSVASRNEHRDMDLFRNPFAMMDNMMAGMRNRMEDMHRNYENVPSDSNTHAFSSSSVMTYSKVGDEPPKVFQASSQTRCVPGGIKETRRTLRDTESGVEKMSIGHHINDRGHVIEKKHNKKSGEREFNQDFQNMDETEAQAFDEEWQQKVSKFQPAAQLSRLEGPRVRAAHRAAITGPEHAHRGKKTKPSEGEKKTHISELNIQGSSMKK
ncbi:myeloid leukemia factor 1 [Ictalurus punctatus]|uniref:Myeloid leukemia factor 1 n=1 Tax=Ictalurus punctatus TaxID=7998 RepID=A0A9F7TDV7_ICTPU|nr:myeloid leukemia factor 1 [Ictalurus punctatus]